MSQVVSIILSGGSGSCLWPASRKSPPKSYVRLPVGNTPIRKAFSCVLRVRPDDAVLAVTNCDDCRLARDCFGAYGNTRSGGSKRLLLNE